MTWRRWVCARIEPLIPDAAPTMPTGLPRSGDWSGGRDTQSSAFLSPPGML